ncbi:hypothetical protein ACFVWR_14675 [Leifsonia sp. NPDC058292]|uniref:hypothetical protein n=1 Tax=Leifsonia sp. NPDC058292 TaxID=3346428 RepID=UPI0036DCEFF4
MAKKALAALIVGVAIALAIPAAATAEPYTKGSSCSIAPTTVSAGATATLTCDAGTFQPSELVAYTVSGENGADANLASYRTSSAHTTKAAASDGSAVLRVTVPKDASGAYKITGIGETSKAASGATVTVLPADGAATKSNDTPASGGSTIASTGSTIAAYIAWIGGALVVLGLIVLALLAARRRRVAP